MNSPPLGVHVLFTFILHACECCMLQYQPPLAVWATSRIKNISKLEIQILKHVYAKHTHVHSSIYLPHPSIHPSSKYGNIFISSPNLRTSTLQLLGIFKICWEINNFFPYHHKYISTYKWTFIECVGDNGHQQCQYET